LYRRLGGPQGQSEERKIPPHRDSIPGQKNVVRKLKYKETCQNLVLDVRVIINRIL
jgi:hypothetical protein